MKYSKFFFNFALALTIPSLIFYPQAGVSAPSTPRFEKKALPAEENRAPISYDALLAFIEAFEEGDLEYSEEHMAKVHRLLALLARQGTLPEDQEALEEDIEELLHQENDPDAHFFSFDSEKDCAFIPAFSLGGEKIFLCKGGMKKHWEKTKQFIKKHRKVLIIGAVVVIVVVTVVCTVGLSSPGASAIAAGAAAASNAGEESEDAVSLSSRVYIETPLGEDPSLKETLEENISAFKELIEEKNLLDASSSAKSPFKDNARDIGSYFAHETLDSLSDLLAVAPHLLQEIHNASNTFFPERPSLAEFNASPMENYEKILADAHKKIDEAFSTDYAKRYTAEAKASREKNFTILELPLPGFFYRGIKIPKLNKAIETTKETAAVAEELGYSRSKITPLEKTGALEKKTATAFETVMEEKAAAESFEKFNKARESLKPYKGKYLSEEQARELIEQTGIRTFPRPQGIPEDFKVRISNRGGGIKYIDPENEYTSIRVMPGKVHSPFPHQREPYVIYTKHGKTLDKHGNIVNKKAPEAHIPLEEFTYRD